MRADGQHSNVQATDHVSADNELCRSALRRLPQPAVHRCSAQALPDLITDKLEAAVWAVIYQRRTCRCRLGSPALAAASMAMSLRTQRSPGQMRRAAHSSSTRAANAVRCGAITCARTVHAGWGGRAWLGARSEAPPPAIHRYEGLCNACSMLCMHVFN